MVQFSEDPDRHGDRSPLLAPTPKQLMDMAVLTQDLERFSYHGGPRADLHVVSALEKT